MCCVLRTSAAAVSSTPVSGVWVSGFLASFCFFGSRLDEGEEAQADPRTKLPGPGPARAPSSPGRKAQRDDDRRVSGRPTTLARRRQHLLLLVTPYSSGFPRSAPFPVSRFPCSPCHLPFSISPACPRPRPSKVRPYVRHCDTATQRGTPLAMGLSSVDHHVTDPDILCQLPHSLPFSDFDISRHALEPLFIPSHRIFPPHPPLADRETLNTAEPPSQIAKQCYRLEQLPVSFPPAFRFCARNPQREFGSRLPHNPVFATPPSELCHCRPWLIRGSVS